MNAAAHQLTAGAAIWAYLAHSEQKMDKATIAPIAGGLVATTFTQLPDILEPATSPNHRQFFHSVLFAGLLIAVFLKLRNWKTEDEAEKLLKGVGEVAIAAYLIHLALDATTSKSLPILGKL